MAGNDDTEDQSGLRFYGIGVVGVDKPRGSNFIMVAPVEKVPMANGRISESKTTLEIDSQDASGVGTSDKVVGQSMIKAKWFPLSEGNRQTAPDVQEGESVRLWRYGNTNEYYWQTMYREPSIRRLETVLYCYGNLSSKGEAWSKDSSYWHEVSTHDKHIRWQTTQSDGEAYAYNFHISAKDSTITLEDNVNNQWFMDSKAVLMRCRNSDGSFIDIEKLRYHSFAQEHMEHQSDITHMHTPLFTVTGNDEGAYRSGAFIQVSLGSGYAQIGSGENAYAHYTGSDIEVKSSSSITEETSSKTVKNSTSTTESGSVTEKYGSVERTAESISESAGSVSRSATSTSDSTESRSVKSGSSQEEFGEKAEKVGSLKQDVDSADSTVKDMKLQSAQQDVKSDTRNEEYGKLHSKVQEKTEEIGSLNSTVSGKESRHVGDYQLDSDKDIVLNASGKVKTTDAEISNLDVPGKIVVSGRDVEKEIDSLIGITDNHESRIEKVEDRLGMADDTFKNQQDQIKENQEFASSTKKELESANQDAAKSAERIQVLEEEMVKAKDRIRVLEEFKEWAIDKFKEVDKRLDEHDKQIAEVRKMAEEAAAAAAAAASAASAAGALAQSANEAASAAGDMAASASAAAASASSGDATAA